jgi:hypothetical protein
MTAERVTVSLDPELLGDVRGAVARYTGTRPAGVEIDQLP